MRWDANSLSARMLHLLHQFVPDQYSVTLILPTSLNTAYSLSPQRRLFSASIKFLWLRQHHDPTAISPALDNALSTLLSCCSQHFIPLYIFRWSRSVTTTVNKPQLQHVGSSNTKNFFSEGQKNLVNSENKENLSNYQPLKRKPSVCSTSLHFSKLITVVDFFFLRHRFCIGFNEILAREIFAAGDRVRVH